MRIIGLDYGSRTVGVAVSDPLGITAQALETIWREKENKLRRTLARINEISREYEAEKIVLGFPVHMNGDVGERAGKTLEFQAMVAKRTGLEVILWDERLTTAAADEILDEMQIRGHRERKAVIDQIAAGIILQEYLDHRESKTDDNERKNTF